MKNVLKKMAWLGMATVAAGCSGLPEAGPPQVETDIDRQVRTSGIEGSVLDVVGGGEAGNVIIGSPRGDAFAGSVNKHLWQASLDTLAFLPLASTDPFTGVIATDWGAAPDAPNERFKVTAYVTDTALTPSALRVAVFRERLAENGAWVAAPVAEETPRRLEDSILVRARQLRIAEAEAAG